MGTTPNLKLPFPELTDVMDGPDAVSDLASATEDYFYNRNLPTGVVRMPTYYWGSGPTYPQTGVRVGDTFIHTTLGALMRFNGGAWRQAERPELPNPAARNALAVNAQALLYTGFEVTDSGNMYRWDGAAFRFIPGPSQWVNLVKNDTYSYTVPQATTVYDLPGCVGTIVVPDGCTMNMEFSAPALYIAGGWTYVRIVLNGEVMDGAAVSSGAIQWAEGKISGSIVGTGAPVAYNVQALWLNNSSSPVGSSKVLAIPEFSMPVRLRYRFT